MRERERDWEFEARFGFIAQIILLKLKYIEIDDVKKEVKNEKRLISITLINKKKDDNKKQKGRFSDLLGFGMSKILHDETNKRDFFALLY